MPNSIRDYTPALSLLSTARLASVPALFNLQPNIEMYGFSLWVQNAAASLYPLIQQLELVLRNSIDKTARARFGDKWWNKIKYDTTKDNHGKFLKCIRDAENSLKKRWKDKEAAHLGLSGPAMVTAAPPEFGHDDIIAATTFSAWESVLLEALHTDNNAEKNDYLWPLSLPKAFRRLNIINNKPTEARRSLINLLKEIRDYRNRLFHHDCLWIKSKTTDAQTAIESIREKINLIEKTLTAISPITSRALTIWGIFENARRICSVAELSIYTDLNYPALNADEPGILSKLSEQADSERASVPIMLENTAYIFYKLR